MKEERDGRKGEERIVKERKIEEYEVSIKVGLRKNAYSREKKRGKIEGRKVEGQREGRMKRERDGGRRKQRRREE